jgi:hypothetical protein
MDGNGWVTVAVEQTIDVIGHDIKAHMAVELPAAVPHPAQDAPVVGLLRPASFSIGLKTVSRESAWGITTA